MKKPRVGVLCRVRDNISKIHGKSLRETDFKRAIVSFGARFILPVKIPALLCMVQRVPRLSMMKVAFMASIPSIALRR